ncbi:hypothetical protein KDY119_03308 [Luteimicrobium xylanilyticum]|uniref:WxL Interacting Protein peptidoglycan binding domain-containing protein n=1 Tax=Luteimicrobium xylanilyticum TaxID=1133546 RepID=A0A5P9QF91_9MICO|nr:DUF916 domain-containing protein [Luteimicrobium xylanilyticum]QFU99772.1 hypothetical protein KDY119_03308 [Luteimicrobium xylanilyticum]
MDAPIARTTSTLPRSSQDAGLLRRVVALAAVVVGLVLALPTTALASVVPAAAASSGTVSWGLAPAAKAPKADVSGGNRANYAYAAKPGATVTDAVVVTNHSAEALDLRVYAADAFTTSSGQLDLLAAGEKSADLGAWTTVAKPSVHVPAHGSTTVRFTVRVPKDATPGDHSAGVVTSLAQRAAGSTVTVDRRLALRMHLRVAGTLAPAMTVSDVQVTAGTSANPAASVPVTVRYRVTNTGNARIVPTGTVAVSGPFGWAKVALPDDAPEVLPGSSVVRTVSVPGVRPLGRASAEVDVHAVAVGVGGGATASASGDASTWAVPWAALVVVVLVVLGAVLLPRLLDRRRSVDGDVVHADGDAAVSPEGPGSTPAS